MTCMPDHTPNRDFWIEQIRLAASVLVGAILFAVSVTWLSTTDLDAHARAHALALALGLPLAIAPFSQAYAIRQKLRNHRLHQRVQRLANSDDLTGLANRRHFTHKATQRLITARDQGKQLALLLVDIDWFKRVNDTFGHEAGDETLCHIANTLIHAAPQGALVARLGGEEFTILCTMESDVHLSELAEAVRKATEAASFIYRGDHISVTISLGLATARTDDTLSALLSRADKALYKAKNCGRNQFALAA